MILSVWMTQPLVADIIAEYKKATTDHDKARLEARLWAQVPSVMRSRVNNVNRRVAFFRELFGSGSYERRAKMMRAPDFLWDRVEKDLTLGTASKILRAAETSGEADLEIAVQRQLELHDLMPVTRILPDGKVARQPKMGARQLRSHRADGTRAHKAVWSQIRVLLADVLRERLGKLAGSFEAERLVDDFERELRSSVELFTERVRKVREHDTKPPVARRKMLEACGVLHMDPPKPGQPCDMKYAQRQMRKLVRTYHPDLGGDRELYERVIAAYSLLKDYCQQQTTQKGKPDVTRENDPAEQA